MTGSLEQLAGLKEKEEEESGSSVHGSENCLCADQAKCADIRFCCEANHFPDCAEGSEEKTATLQVRL